MIRPSTLHIPVLIALLMLGVGACQPVAAASKALPAPTVDTPKAAAHGEQVAVLAGGCFWGIEAVFERVKGVREVTAGYSGGDAGTANYQDVSDGDSGHAESVRITFDPAQVSYGQLLQVFFSVALDPTQLNRQGPDSGTQYRSVIFYGDAGQQKIAGAYLAQLAKAKAFAAPIVTQLVPLRAFYPAEAYHQQFYDRHPHNPYIVFNDAPKVRQLEKLFPTLYQTPAQFVEVHLH